MSGPSFCRATVLRSPPCCSSRSASAGVGAARPAGIRGTVTRTVTTNAQGGWADTFDTGPGNDGQGGGTGGTWTVSARYAGNSTRQGSGPVECTFQEEPG